MWKAHTAIMAYYGQPQGGGYGGVDPNVLAWFQAVDLDRSGQISATELQQALTNNDWSSFSIKTCYKMIGMFDRNFTGTIDLNEFNSLWSYINQWRGVFQAYDRDRSGNISEQELHTALQQMGYNLTPNFVSTAVWRYDTTGRRQLTFESFINCCVTLQALTGFFRTKDTAMRGQTQISYEDFMFAAVENSL